MLAFLLVLLSPGLMINLGSGNDVFKLKYDSIREGFSKLVKGIGIFDKL